jgi:hypothetical protein
MGEKAEEQEGRRRFDSRKQQRAQTTQSQHESELELQATIPTFDTEIEKTIHSLRLSTSKPPARTHPAARVALLGFVNVYAGKNDQIGRRCAA